MLKRYIYSSCCQSSMSSHRTPPFLPRAGTGEVPRHLGRIRSQRSRPAVRVDRIIRVAATVEVSGRPRDDRGRLHRPRGRHCPLSSPSVQCQIFICSRYASNRCTESCLLPSQRSFLPYEHLQCRSHGCRLIGSPTSPSHPTAADESVEGAGEARHLCEQPV